ncbi:metal dependent phosphohydrolase [Desulfarculus baarsii DSM 2075]|uniref:Metal dependent phosphohydrolase n=1 Tax=Desulfarculus baarsii (strain ATCC 33931 / DSM 2075 / LMG 7858 / VKM B-1802 / 2st14) TaxID=644282 RepID=E1QL34_DESB2|nr:HDOD domain-containing protein [Desulfarculus baarsii]ADK85299.1 metal dependent phosphohydrolase [Desulfarculus baarsii DSM 2075]
MTNKYIKGLRYVPSLPTVLAKIMALLDDEKTSVADLEAVIVRDQALTSKVLSIANSAYWGLRHEVVSIERATVLLGFEEISNICLGAGLIGFLHPSIFRNREGAEQLWLHTLAVAEAAQAISREMAFIEAGSAFTAGLLHDLGKAVLAAFHPGDVEDVLRLMQREKLSFRQAEMANECDHAAIGGELAQHWGIPASLGQVMAMHHEPPPDAQLEPLVAAVHAADYLVRDMGIGDSGNPDKPTVEARVLDWLGLGDSLLRSIKRDLAWRRPAIEDLWKELIS